MRLSLGLNLTFTMHLAFCNEHASRRGSNLVGMGKETAVQISKGQLILFCEGSV